MLTETVHIAVPTAFSEDETLNIAGTIDHIRNLYEQGVKSVLVSGTTGEQHSLTLHEKMDMINGLEREGELIHHMEIIFGLSSIRLKEAEQLAEMIRHTNIAGIMIGYPPYVIPTQEEALIYTNRLIDLSHKPTILYNNPRRTGFDLLESTIIQLSENKLVVGIKDAGNKEKIEQIKKYVDKDNFYFYAGGEVNLEEKISYGYNRLSSIAGNISPIKVSEWFHKMIMQNRISPEENNYIEHIMSQVYQGNAIVNLKKIINNKSIQIGICRSPIGMI